MGYKIFLHTPDDTACSFYRGALPFRYCYGRLSQEGIYLASEMKPTEGEDFDCLIFNRLIRQDFYHDFVLKLVNKKLVFQTDDDIWHIPQWNPASGRVKQEDFETTQYFLYKSERIITSTEPLADLINLREKTVVLPNLVDPALFPPDAKRNGNRPLKILWSGSASHHGDLLEVVEAIIKISEKYGDDVGIIFWGYLPSELANFERVPGFPFAEIVSKYPNVYKGEWFNLSLYWDKLSQLEPDIAIIPLQNCQFNYSKSNLKWLEMTMAGAACIASNLPPYQCIKNNETGILASNSQEWYDGLVELIENKDFRLRIAENAKQQVREEFSWHCSAKKKWEDFFISLKT